MGLLAIVFLVAGCVEAATVSGTVYLRSGQTRHSLAGVRVMARAADGAEVFQSTESDAQGRYALVDLPRSRISLGASKPGYVTLATAIDGARLLVDLAADETLDGIDFEALRGGVVTGRIIDAMGEPLEGVQVSLWRITHFGGRHRSGSTGAATDDRGIYRVFGLEPGRYILLARPTQRLGEQRAVALFYPGRTEESRAEEIEVAAGREVTGIDLTLGTEPSYRIAGKIVEADREQLTHIYVQAVTAERSIPGGLSSLNSVDAEGNFTLPGLPAGAYIFTASQRTGTPQGDKILARQRIDLRANLTNLLVRPGRPGFLSGRVTFSEAEPIRAKPDQVRIRVMDRGNLQSTEAVAQAPDYRFEFSSLWPGVYSFELVSPAGAYLKKMTQGGQRMEAPEVSLAEGGSAAVELEVAFGLGRVRGLVKAPGSSNPLAYARVALARPGGRPVEFRTAQADQRGRWLLSDVRPGEYRICAWPRVSVEALYGPETWEQAGRSVRTFAVEPGAEVEVELTAAGGRGERGQ